MRNLFFCLFIFSSCSLTYISRYVFWNFSDIEDYKKYPRERISKAEVIFNFKKNSDFETNQISVDYYYKGKKITNSLDNFLKMKGTTAFIIIKNSKILYEKYFNGYQRESINTSFSVAKSFVSALIGIAIKEGWIKSVNDRVIDYIPELKDKISEKLTIKHLLNMTSGIKYNPSYFPWADEPKSIYFPDLRKLMFKVVKQDYEPGKYFKYANYNTVLLGIILERATKMSLAEYLEEKIWKRIGTEFEASWCLDSKKTKFPLMSIGINARSIDFAKFGWLFLNNGKWDDKQIIPENWVKESTVPFEPQNPDYYFFKNYYPYTIYFKDNKFYYKYGWWCFKTDNGYDYMAIGYHGQFIYVCPEKKIVIVRNGKKWCKTVWWPKFFREITEKF